MSSMINVLLAFAISLAGIFAAGLSSAQTYPNRPIRLIISPAAGGPTDTVGRIVANKLSEVWGQQIIIDNRPGAGNTIGAGIAAKATPDGYTLHVCSISDTISPAVFANLPYNYINDFAHISPIGTTPNVLVVHPSVPTRSIQDFISYVKERPGQLNYGSNGTGSSLHLSMEWFKSIKGLNIVLVPYKGAPTTALLGGEVAAAIDNLPGQLPHIANGKLRALAVTSLKRSKQLPQVPTFDESDVKGFDVTVWYGLCTPAAVPKNIVNKINADMVKVLSMTDLRARLEQQGVEAGSSSSDQFSAFFRSETKKWARIAKDAGIQPQ